MFIAQSWTEWMLCLECPLVNVLLLFLPYISMYHASVPMNTYIVFKDLEVHEFTCYRLSLHWKVVAIRMQPWYPYRSVSLPPQTVLLSHGCRSLALHYALHIDS